MDYNSDRKDDANIRTEEVQAIVDRMPTYWVKWFALGVFALIGMIVCSDL